MVSRGVGSIAHLMRLTTPLLKPGGRLLLRKPCILLSCKEAKPVLASGIWETCRHSPCTPQSENGLSPWVLLAIHRGSGHI